LLLIETRFQTPKNVPGRIARDPEDRWVASRDIADACETLRVKIIAV
jgi:hypothetical protein